MLKRDKEIHINSNFKYTRVFKEIAKNNKDINFEIYTLSDIKSHLKNFKIPKK